ncbi:MAG: heparan-alpha-glucosaminide N-acetyltransferase domain-containing protein [Candidatus Aminicenantes bacterium]|jgi:predicted acyltransferase
MASERLTSLDIFRGMTIALMIVVNNPGSWEYVYASLSHAEWHGWTPTDLVFPFFLFIVGVSLSFSLTKRKSQGAGRSQLYFKIFRRSGILFGLGLLLRLIPRFDFSTLRIPGVLQRIAVCYLLASLVFLKTGTKMRILISAGCLVAYWLILKLIPVPGYGAGVLELEGNLCAYIDTQLLSGHLYTPNFDPEGILSTLPALVTTLLGTVTGDWLHLSRSKSLKVFGLLSAGSVLTMLGLWLHRFFPINKQLWTSTFVIFTAGTALLVLGLCYALADGLGIKKWAYPFLVFGANAITVYVGSALIAKILGIVKISSGSETVPVKTFIYYSFLQPIAGNYIGSLIFPMLLLFLWFLILWPLYKKRIYIRI